MVKYESCNSLDKVPWHELGKYAQVEKNKHQPLVCSFLAAYS
jgi:hypothetical protein